MISIHFPFKAKGINHYQKNTANGRRYITNEGRQYKKLVQTYLDFYTNDFIHIKNKYNTKYQGFYFVFYYYQSNFFKKDGTINMRAGDVDAPLKILIDCVFEKLNIDDSHLVKLECTKIPSSKNCFTIEIGTIEYPEPYDLLINYESKNG